ncbi:sugar ABC transporter ATP-binding protein [Actinotalea sp. M2MS4P-6]|uniref:sugar ABC transporter ATP-binding protein n=1 Tax=Actinotalea sp. M2MS4P-6 TaxID=2983762 RepID=UPI0021E45CE4|nr:sugar ABC transporter ATP-binding protein [Actinotalea sp. M2MS4P-6]MCV2393874.1 sugar ABC transporter ATP-binding protein [Actinotalea sp. M2MS4P-6]
MYTLEAQDISKSYGGVRALDRAAIAVRPGSVHALLGENGAGKSTLVKIMTGAIRPDSGVLRLDGADVRFASTADAFRQGVGVVSQELSLFPHLSVLANMFPMREPRRGPFVDRREMLRLAVPILDELGLEVDPMVPVSRLPLAERQLVEIGKALVTKPRVLLLDEPTSALESGATDRLLHILRVLRSQDVAVVFVSHILEEVMSVCDEITVLRDGVVVTAGEDVGAHTVESVVSAMIGDRPRVVVRPSGRALAEQAVATTTSGLRVDGVTLHRTVQDVSFAVEPGEIVGLAGLAGSGPAELLRALAGIESPVRGTISLPGGIKAPHGQRAHIAAGVAYVSGDRRRLGLMLDKPVWENVVQVRTMAMGKDGAFLRVPGLVTRAGEHMSRLNIRASSPEATAGSLSGGNQQKVVLAKWLDNTPSTIVLDDPTRGVDIGAKAEIHGLLGDLAAAGAVVVLRSTDLEELVAVCERVIVLYRGRICAELRGDGLSTSALLQLMNTGELAPEGSQAPAS